VSNPVYKLRRIIAPSRATRGVVVAVENGLAKVATTQGLVEHPAEEWIIPGMTVTIVADGRLVRPQGGGQEYYL